MRKIRTALTATVIAGSIAIASATSAAAGGIDLYWR